MTKFSKENLARIIGNGCNPMTEFYILKDLHTGEYVLDNYIVSGTHFMGCISFLISEVLDVGLDLFCERVLDLIPRSLMSPSEITEKCGSKISTALYRGKDERYKPIVYNPDNNEHFQKLYFDKDVVLEYCSEHQEDLSEAGKKFFGSRKSTYRHDRCILFDKNKLLESANGADRCQVSVDGCLTLQFD